MYSTINKAAVASCIIGKSNMFRRSSLTAVGGLRYFGKYMCEDNIIGEYLWKEGWRHRLTSDLAYQTLGDSLSLWAYIQRRARWIRIRKYTVTAATLAEPFSESIVSGLWASWAVSATWGIPMWKFLLTGSNHSATPPDVCHYVDRAGMLGISAVGVGDVGHSGGVAWEGLQVATGRDGGAEYETSWWRVVAVCKGAIAPEKEE
ncbi:hypothetical protein HDV00_002615 [Rhizophlyctis rosea]|nr:hypothetical protein HDV00_002615 [Rhizophlyctis rosea]